MMAEGKMILLWCS